MLLRLQKILSHAGVASRRAAEKLMAEGRVTVNGQTIRELGTKADPAHDVIRVDGSRIKSAERHRYLLLNKPRGFVTTRSDEKRRRTVLDLLQGVREYVYPVGRLDYDTEGLLLLTNDGDLAAQLTHPRHGVERTYEAHVAGVPDERAIDKLRTGIPLDGRRTLPAEVTLLNRDRDANAALLITIREGRNRQVRRMCEAVGHPVDRLRRIRLGPLVDRKLPVGAWRDLSEDEIAKLRAYASPTRASSAGVSQGDRGNRGENFTARSARSSAGSKRDQRERLTGRSGRSASGSHGDQGDRERSVTGRSVKPGRTAGSQDAHGGRDLQNRRSGLRLRNPRNRSGRSR